MAKATQTQSKAAMKNVSATSLHSVVRIENILLVVIAAVLLVGGSLLWQFSGNIKQATAALQSEVANITTIVQRVSTDIDGFHSSVGDMASDISQMSADLNHVSAEVSRIAADVSQTSAEVGRMAVDVSQTSAEVSRVSSEMVLLAADVTQIQNRLDIIEPLLIQDEAWQLAAPAMAPVGSASASADNTLVPSDRVTGVVYRVRPGDTLWHISHSLLGSPHHYPVISELNELDPPNLIRPGDQLLIPVEPHNRHDISLLK